MTEQEKRKIRNARYYAQNKQKISKRAIEFRETHKFEINKNNRDRYINDIEYQIRRKKEAKRCYERTKKVWNKRTKLYLLHRYKTDPDFRLCCSLKAALSRTFSESGIKKLHHTFSFIGCDLPTFKQHIEKQFYNGMSWCNKGTHWHIDHIIPIEYFQTNKIAVSLAWHFTNLQPLDPHTNISEKGAKIIPKYIQKLITNTNTPPELLTIATKLISEALLMNQQVSN